MRSIVRYEAVSDTGVIEYEIAAGAQYPMSTAIPHVVGAIVRQCTARSKRTGVQCQQHAMHGSTKCYHHGGATPRGLASVHTKHGLRSQHMPARLVARFEQALSDPALLEQTRNLALTETRIAELLEQLDAAGGRARWEQLAELHTRLELCLPIDAHRDTRAALDELGALIQAGRSDYTHWDALLTTMDLQRKLADTERKRMQAAERSISVQELGLFVARLQDILLRNIADMQVRARIATELDAMWAANEAPSR